MDTIAVIGAMYGDEGKGLMVDYFSSKMLEKYQPQDGAVVRFQGGCQSGHTVVTPEGVRHIHQHFGSGTLLGIPTILTQDFVCNPVLFLKEYNELVAKGFTPEVYVEGQSPISTPYDILLNRAIEDSRGDNRHGSVGVGFGETVERHEVGQVRLTYKDLHSNHHTSVALQRIREYALERAKELGLNLSDIQDLDNSKIFDGLMLFRSIASMMSIRIPLDFLILEGGQGLALDMVYGEYPHVTRSRTGLTHAKAFCNRHEYPLDKVVYVTRAYTTRHGAGPLKSEMPLSGIPEFVDTTNIYGKYQGGIRVAPLEFIKMLRLIECDSWDFPGKVELTMTCLDHMPDEYTSWADGNLDSARAERVKYLSYGPKRTDVVKI